MKSQNEVYDELFSSREYAKYPHEEVVRFVARHFYPAPDRGSVRLLDLGCGPGADLWYLAREGFQTAGMDGSTVALRRAKARLEQEGLTAELVQGELGQLPWPEHQFDGVIDCRAIQCNRFASAQQIVQECHRVLKPGGYLFSSILTDRTYAYGQGQPIEPGGFTGIPDGPSAGSGFNLFLGRAQLDTLFRPFGEVRVELSALTFGGMRHLVEAWNVVARKS